MTAIITTEGIGLFNSSKTQLGTDGIGFGSAGDKAYVNAETGNLIIQRKDQVVVGHGMDTSVVRTYNSLGNFSDLDGDNTYFNFNQRLDISQSVPTRTSRDGYTQNFLGEADSYYSDEGAGAQDTLKRVDNEWIWEEGTSGIKEYYDLGGNLSRIQDREGFGTTYVRVDDTLYITDEGNQVTEIGYTASQQVVSVKTYLALNIDGGGIPTPDESTDAIYTTYRYTAEGQLDRIITDLTPFEISDSYFYVTQYTYHATTPSLITQVQQGNVYGTDINSVQADGRIGPVLSADDGMIIQFEYDAANQKVAKIIEGREGNERVTAYNYQQSVTNVETYIKTFGDTAVIKSTTSYHYDADHQIVKVESPVDSVGRRYTTQYRYSDRGDLVYSKDGDNNITRFHYDYQDDGLTNDQQVSMPGLLEWQIDGEGNTKRFYYNAHNQVISEARYTTADSDAADDVLSASNAEVTRFIYDDKQRLVFTISPGLNVTEIQYADLDSTTKERTVKTYRYLETLDAGVLLDPSVEMSESSIQTLDKSGAERTDTLYDFRGQVKQITMFSEIASAGQYTASSQNTTAHFIYDQNGNLIKQIDGRGVAPSESASTAQNDIQHNSAGYETLYVYDGLGRLLATAVANNVDQEGAVLQEDNTIDAVGALLDNNTGATKFNSITTYSANIDNSHQQVITTTYANGLVQEVLVNDAGELIRQRQYDSNIGDNVAGNLGTVSYYYDEAGRQRAIKDAEGVITHTLYDNRGLVLASVDGSGAMTEYEYNASGQVSRAIQYANYLSIAQLSLLVRHEADSSLTALDTNIETIRPTYSGDDRVLTSLYDASNRLVFSIDGEGYVTEFEYDGAGQLINTIQHSTPYEGYSVVNESGVYVSKTLDLELETVREFSQYSYSIDGAYSQKAAKSDGDASEPVSVWGESVWNLNSTDNSFWASGGTEILYHGSVGGWIEPVNSSVTEGHVSELIEIDIITIQSIEYGNTITITTSTDESSEDVVVSFVPDGISGTDFGDGYRKYTVQIDQSGLHGNLNRITFDQNDNGPNFLVTDVRFVPGVDQGSYAVDNVSWEQGQHSVTVPFNLIQSTQALALSPQGDLDARDKWLANRVGYNQVFVSNAYVVSDQLNRPDMEVIGHTVWETDFTSVSNTSDSEQVGFVGINSDRVGLAGYVVDNNYFRVQDGSLVLTSNNVRYAGDTNWLGSNYADTNRYSGTRNYSRNEAIKVSYVFSEDQFDDNKSILLGVADENGYQHGMRFYGDKSYTSSGSTASIINWKTIERVVGQKYQVDIDVVGNQLNYSFYSVGSDGQLTALNTTGTVSVSLSSSWGESLHSFIDIGGSNGELFVHSIREEGDLLASPYIDVINGKGYLPTKAVHDFTDSSQDAFNFGFSGYDIGEKLFSDDPFAYFSIDDDNGTDVLKVTAVDSANGSQTARLLGQQSYVKKANTPVSFKYQITGGKNSNYSRTFFGVTDGTNQLGVKLYRNDATASTGVKGSDKGSMTSNRDLNDIWNIELRVHSGKLEIYYYKDGEPKTLVYEEWLGGWGESITSVIEAQGESSYQNYSLLVLNAEEEGTTSWSSELATVSVDGGVGDTAGRSLDAVFDIDDVNASNYLNLANTSKLEARLVRTGYLNVTDDMAITTDWVETRISLEDYAGQVDLFEGQSLSAGEYHVEFRITDSEGHVSAINTLPTSYYEGAQYQEDAQTGTMLEGFYTIGGNSGRTLDINQYQWLTATVTNLDTGVTHTATTDFSLNADIYSGYLHLSDDQILDDGLYQVSVKGYGKGAVNASGDELETFEVQHGDRYDFSHQLTVDLNTDPSAPNVDESKPVTLYYWKADAGSSASGVLANSVALTKSDGVWSAAAEHLLEGTYKFTIHYSQEGIDSEAVISGDFQGKPDGVTGDAYTVVTNLQAEAAYSTSELVENDYGVSVTNYLGAMIDNPYHSGHQIRQAFEGVDIIPDVASIQWLTATIFDTHGVQVSSVVTHVQASAWADGYDNQLMLLKDEILPSGDYTVSVSATLVGNEVRQLSGFEFSVSPNQEQQILGTSNIVWDGDDSAANATIRYGVENSTEYAELNISDIGGDGAPTAMLHRYQESQNAYNEQSHELFAAQGTDGYKGLNIQGLSTDVQFSTTARHENAGLINAATSALKTSTEEIHTTVIDFGDNSVELSLSWQPATTEYDLTNGNVALLGIDGSHAFVDSDGLNLSRSMGDDWYRVQGERQYKGHDASALASEFHFTFDTGRNGYTGFIGLENGVESESLGIFLDQGMAMSAAGNLSQNALSLFASDGVQLEERTTYELVITVDNDIATIAVVDDNGVEIQTAQHAFVTGGGIVDWSTLHSVMAIRGEETAIGDSLIITALQEQGSQVGSSITAEFKKESGDAWESATQIEMVSGKNTYSANFLYEKETDENEGRYEFRIVETVNGAIVKKGMGSVSIAELLVGEYESTSSIEFDVLSHTAEGVAGSAISHFFDTETANALDFAIATITDREGQVVDTVMTWGSDKDSYYERHLNLAQRRSLLAGDYRIGVKYVKHNDATLYNIAAFDYVVVDNAQSVTQTLRWDLPDVAVDSNVSFHFRPQKSQEAYQQADIIVQPNGTYTANITGAEQTQWEYKIIETTGNSEHILAETVGELTLGETQGTSLANYLPLRDALSVDSLTAYITGTTELGVAVNWTVNTEVANDAGYDGKLLLSDGQALENGDYLIEVVVNYSDLSQVTRTPFSHRVGPEEINTAQAVLINESASGYRLEYNDPISGQTTQLFLAKGEGKSQLDFGQLNAGQYAYGIEYHDTGMLNTVTKEGVVSVGAQVAPTVDELRTHFSYQSSLEISAGASESIVGSRSEDAEFTLGYVANVDLVRGVTANNLTLATRIYQERKNFDTLSSWDSYVTLDRNEVQYYVDGGLNGKNGNPDPRTEYAFIFDQLDNPDSNWSDGFREFFDFGKISATAKLSSDHGFVTNLAMYHHVNYIDVQLYGDATTIDRPQSYISQDPYHLDTIGYEDTWYSATINDFVNGYAPWTLADNRNVDLGDVGTNNGIDAFFVRYGTSTGRGDQQSYGEWQHGGSFSQNTGRSSNSVSEVVLSIDDVIVGDELLGDSFVERVVIQNWAGLMGYYTPHGDDYWMASTGGNNNGTYSQLTIQVVPDTILEIVIPDLHPADRVVLNYAGSQRENFTINPVDNIATINLGKLYREETNSSIRELIKEGHLGVSITRNGVDSYTPLGNTDGEFYTLASGVSLSNNLSSTQTSEVYSNNVSVFSPTGNGATINVLDAGVILDQEDLVTITTDVWDYNDPEVKMLYDRGIDLNDKVMQGGWFSEDGNVVTVSGNTAKLHLLAEIPNVTQIVVNGESYDYAGQSSIELSSDEYQHKARGQYYYQLIDSNGIVLGEGDYQITKSTQGVERTDVSLLSAEYGYDVYSLNGGESEYVEGGLWHGVDFHATDWDSLDLYGDGSVDWEVDVRFEGVLGQTEVITYSSRDLPIEGWQSGGFGGTYLDGVLKGPGGENLLLMYDAGQDAVAFMSAPEGIFDDPDLETVGRQYRVQGIEGLRAWKTVVDEQHLMIDSTSDSNGGNWLELENLALGTDTGVVRYKLQNASGPNAWQELTVSQYSDNFYATKYDTIPVGIYQYEVFSNADLGIPVATGRFAIDSDHVVEKVNHEEIYPWYIPDWTTDGRVMVLSDDRYDEFYSDPEKQQYVSPEGGLADGAYLVQVNQVNDGFSFTQVLEVGEQNTYHTSPVFSLDVSHRPENANINLRYKDAETHNWQWASVGEINDTGNVDIRLDQVVFDGRGANFNPNDPRIITSITDYDFELIYTDTTTQKELFSAQGTFSADPSNQATQAINVTFERDINGRELRQFHDVNGQVHAQLGSDGSVIEYVYDGIGRKVETIQYATRIEDESLRVNGTLTDIFAIAKASSTTEETEALAEAIHQYALYNSKGQVVATIDGEGYVTESQYTDDGLLLKSIVHGARLTPGAMPWLESNHGIGVSMSDLQFVTLPAGDLQEQSVQFSYGAQGQVLTQTDHTGTRTKSIYDAMSQVVQSTTGIAVVNDIESFEESRTTQADYDAAGRVVHEYGDRNEWNYTYDLNGRRTQAELVSDEQNHGERVTRGFFDASGRQVFTLNGENELSELIYNTFGEVIGNRQYTNRVDPELVNGLMGGLLSQELLSLFRSFRTKEDSVNLAAFDRRGSFVIKQDALGHQVATQYNAFGEKVRDTRFVDGGELDGQEIHNDYFRDASGRVINTSEDSLGLRRNVHVSYDAFGRVVESTDAKGNVSSFEYDKRGRQLSVTQFVNNGDEIKTRTIYDAFDRALTTIDANQQSTVYQYNDQQRSVTITTPENVSITTWSNRHGEQRLIQDAELGRTLFVYDDRGQLQKTFLHSDNLASVDLSGDEVAIASAISAFVSSNSELADHESTYYSSGLLKESVDANGVKVFYRYDAALRSLSRQVDPDGLNLESRYIYDAKGQRIVEQQVQQHAAAGLQEILIETQTEYDAKGNVTSVSVMDNLNGEQVAITNTTFTYDDQGKQLSVGVGGYTGVVVDEDSGERIALTATNYTQNEYDRLGRLVKTTVDPSWIDKASGEVQREGLDIVTQYRYDLNNNVIQQTNGNGNSTWFVYDERNLQRFSINSLGEITETRYDDMGRSIANVQYQHRIGTYALHTFTTVESVQNIITAEADDRLTSFVYDNDGRLRFVIQPDNTVVESVYDDNGRVVVSIAHDGMLAADFVLNDTDNGARVAQVQGALDAIKAVIESDPLLVDRTRQSFSYFDALGRVTSKIEAAGYLTTHQYDRVGNTLSTTTYAEAITASNPSDADVNLHINAHQSDAANRTNYFGFNAAGQLRFNVDAEGRLTENIYDELGRKTVSRIFESPIPSSYINNGVLDVELAAAYTDIQAAIQEQGNQPVNPYRENTTEYDAAGRVISETDAMGGSEYYEYDGASNRTGLINKMGDRWGYQFDGANRLIAEVTPRVVQTRVTGLNYEQDFSENLDGLLGSLVALPVGVDHVKGEQGYLTYNTKNATQPHTLSTEMVSQSVDRYQWQMELSFGGDISAMDATVGLIGSNESEVNRELSVHFSNGTAKLQSLLDDTTGALSEDLLGLDGNPVQIEAGTHYVITTHLIKDGDYVADDNVPPQIVWQPNTSAVIQLSRRVGEQLEVLASTVLKTDWISLYIGTTAEANMQLLSGSSTQVDSTVNVYSAYRMTPAPGLGELNANQHAEEYLESSITRFEYDGLGHVTRQIDAAGSIEQREVGYVYDKLGRQISTLYPEVLVYQDTNIEGDLLNSQRFDISTRPRETTWFDSVGNAVVHESALGHYSYKIYDQANRVAYEIDGDGYVTGYGYDVFGNVVELTRYATAITDPVVNAPPHIAPSAPDLVKLEVSINFEAFDVWINGSTGLANINGADNRTINTVFDKSNRKLEVYQPNVLTVNSGSENIIALEQAITHYQYNGWGELLSEQKWLGDEVTTNTHRYYDNTGKLRAEVGATGYVTTQSYDANGNLVDQVEYAKALDVPNLLTALTSSNDIDWEVVWEHAQVIAHRPTVDLLDGGESGFDRIRHFEYDALNRQVSESWLDVVVDSVIFADAEVSEYYPERESATPVREFKASVLVNEAQYDALGRAVVMTSHNNANDTIGASTYTYYDALGRISATIEPERFSEIQDTPERTVITHDGKGTSSATLSWQRPQIAGLQKAIFDYKSLDGSVSGSIEIDLNIESDTIELNVSGLMTDRYEYQISYIRFGESETFGVASGEIDIITDDSSSSLQPVSWVTVDGNVATLHLAGKKSLIDSINVNGVTYSYSGEDEIDLNANNQAARGQYHYALMNGVAVVGEGDYQIIRTNDDALVSRSDTSLLSVEYSSFTKIISQQYYDYKKEKWRHENKFSVSWDSLKAFGSGDIEWEVKARFSNVRDGDDLVTFRSSDAGHKMGASIKGLGGSFQNGLSFRSESDRSSKGRSLRLEQVEGLRVWKVVDGQKRLLIDSGSGTSLQKKMEVVNLNLNSETAVIRYRPKVNDTQRDALGVSKEDALIWRELTLTKVANNTYTVGTEGIPIGLYEYEISADTNFDAPIVSDNVVIGGQVDAYAEIESSHKAIISPLTTFGYDALGNQVSQLRHQNGAAMHDQSQFTVKSSSHEQDQQSYWRYDANGNMLQYYDAEGVSTYFSYDEKSNVRKEWRRVSNVEDSNFATFGQVHEYDARGNKTAVITLRPNYEGDGPQLATTEMQINAFGEMSNRRLKEDAANDEWHEYFKYDAAGQLIRTNSGSGVDRVYFYDQKGRTTREISNSGMGFESGSALDVTNYDLDLAGLTELLSTGRGQLRHTIYQHDALDRAVSQTGVQFTSDGQTYTPETFQRYDRWGKTIESESADGEKTLIRYNQQGGMISQTQAAVNGVLVVDEHGVESTQSQTTTFYFDMSGRGIAKVDANDHTSASSYDAAGQKTKIVAADGSVSYKRMDALARVREDTDGLGHSQYYLYDRLDRMTNHYTPSGGEIQYEYDEAGNRVRTKQLLVREGDGTWITNQSLFDAEGRVISQFTQNSEASGNLTGTLYQYDRRGNKVSEVKQDHSLHIKGGNFQWVADWQYDAFGHLTGRTDFVASSAVEGGITYNYVYDNAGQLRVETNSLGKNRQNTYLNSGMLAEDNDVTINLKTVYSYDEMGRQVKEQGIYDKYLTGFNNTIELTGSQTTEIKYDYLGRITQVASQGEGDAALTDYTMDLRYYYDAVGNRRAVSRVVDTVEQDKLWYAFDEMDRLTVSQGQLQDQGNGTSNIVITKNEKSQSLVYDAAGNRVSAVRYLKDDAIVTTTEKYLYDADNRHQATVISDQGNGGFVSKKHYDRLGRMTIQFNYDYTAETDEDGYAKLGDTPSQVILTEYDTAGRTTATRYYDFNEIAGVLGQGIDIDDENLFAAIKGAGVSASLTLDKYEYDGAGMRAYTYTSESAKIEYTYSFIGNNGIKADRTEGKETSGKLLDGTVKNHYDVNGNLQRVDDQHTDDGKTKDRYFISNSQGQFIKTVRVDEGNKQQFYFYANGQGVATNGEIDGLDIDYNFSAINDNYPSAAPGSYTVNRNGETLQNVAVSVWGDSSLWYLIGEANGLSAGDALKAGQTLIIPNSISNVRNASDTFKPYNPSSIIGDTTPTMPIAPPPKEDGGGCGVAQILIIIIVIVASIFTAGAAAAAFATVGAGVGGSLFAIGSAVMAGTAGVGFGATVAIAFVAGAVGNIAGQLVGMAAGVQDDFSWSQVGQAGLTSAVTAGIGQWANGAKTAATVSESSTFFEKMSSYSRTAGNYVSKQGSWAKAGVQAVGSYAVNAATGIGEKFSWAGVAGAMGASYVQVPSLDGNVLGKTINGTVSGIAKREIIRGMGKGGKQTDEQIAANAFGQAIGDGIVDKMKEGGSFTVTDDNGKVWETKIVNGESKKTLVGVNSTNGDTALSDMLMGEMQASYGDKPLLDSDDLFENLGDDVLVAGLSDWVPDVLDIPYNIATGDIEDIQERLNLLTEKARNSESFNESEKEFMVDFNRSLARGGKFKWLEGLKDGVFSPEKGLWEAAALTERYVDQSHLGETLIIDSEIYETSTIVNYAMDKMKEMMVLDIEKSGSIRSGGEFSSKDVFSKVWLGDVDKYGMILKDGALLAEQSNARLKYANNRFELKSSSQIILDDSGVIEIETTWGVVDNWDFESFAEQKAAGVNYVTELPVRGGQKIEFHDGLSAYLTEIGVAKEFEYKSEWKETWKIEK